MISITSSLNLLNFYLFLYQSRRVAQCTDPLLLTCRLRPIPFAAPASSSSADDKSASGSAWETGGSGGGGAGSEDPDRQIETGRQTWVPSQTAAGADRWPGRMQTGGRQRNNKNLNDPIALGEELC